MPANYIPEVEISLIDKWVHFILFGVLSFLWLFSMPSPSPLRQLIIVLACIALGYAVEIFQGMLGSLGRSQDNLDAIADGIGVILGFLVYKALQSFYRKRNRTLS